MHINIMSEFERQTVFLNMSFVVIRATLNTKHERRERKQRKLSCHGKLVHTQITKVKAFGFWFLVTLSWNSDKTPCNDRSQV